MLKLLKESVTSRHGERLEQIVIVLIGIEICEWNVSITPLQPYARSPRPAPLLHLTCLCNFKISPKFSIWDDSKYWGMSLFTILLLVIV
jgi:hypothetical protein